VSQYHIQSSVKAKEVQLELGMMIAFPTFVTKDPKKA
jgi:hypothetical protein